MIIKNSEGQEIYNKRSNGNLDTDSIINAIVKAGGVEQIHVKLYDNGFTMNEFINSVRFLKSINFDINQLPIEQYREYGGIELIEQGYDMYKIGEDNVPVITECGYGVLKECIKQGLDLNKFNVDNHFRSEIDYDERGNSRKVHYSDISNFIRYKESIDYDKFSLLADNGLLNEKTLKDLEGDFGPLYYKYQSAMNKETFKKVLNAYDKIELNIDKIQEIHDMDLCYFNGSGNFKIQLIDRFLETSANKDSAINEIYQSLEKRGENINSKDNLPFINMIKKHTKQEQNEIQEVFTHTAPKPSTRRRM